MTSPYPIVANVRTLKKGLGERHQGRRWLEAVQRLRPEGEIDGRERIDDYGFHS